MRLRSGRLALEGRKNATGGTGTLAIENGRASSPNRRSTIDGNDPTSPPPYTATAHGSGLSGLGRSASLGAAAKSKPPPPKPKPSRLSGVPAMETVTALYDYEAQAEGDLSFSAGEVIEIVSRTVNENEWWVGRLAGREGQFPGESTLS